MLFFGLLATHDTKNWHDNFKTKIIILAIMILPIYGNITIGAYESDCASDQIKTKLVTPKARDNLAGL